MLNRISIAMLVFLVSCSNHDLSDESFNLSGTILTHEIPAKAVEILLIGEDSLHTTSDDEGYFLIEQLESGDYELILSHNKQNTVENTLYSFSEKSYNITLTRNTYLQELILPKPVTVSARFNDTKDSVLISWSSYEGDDFREYRLHRGDELNNKDSGSRIYTTNNHSKREWKYYYEVNGYGGSHFRVFTMKKDYSYLSSNIVRVYPSMEDEPVIQPDIIYNLDFVSKSGIPVTYISSITGDDKSIWILTNNTDKLIKYDPISYTVLKSFNIPKHDPVGYYSGLTWDGKYLWLGFKSTYPTNHSIIKLDPTSQTIIKEYVSPECRGLSWDGEKLWMTSTNGVYNMDTLTGSFEQRFETQNSSPGNISTYKDELWIKENSSIYIYDRNTYKFKGITNLNIPGAFCLNNNGLYRISNSNFELYEINTVD